MIRLWLAFIVLAMLTHFGLQAWRDMSGKERWSLAKSIGYSLLVSLITISVMTIFVLIF